MTNGNGADPKTRSDRPISDPDDATAFFATLSQELLTDLDEQATLQRICDQAMRLIPAADFCGITVRRRRGRLTTLAQTDEVALLCDELQYELGEGPCVDSALEGEPFLVTSTGDDERWPRWGPRVAEEGVHALISVELTGPAWHSRDDPLGAVNLYGRQVGAFSDRELARARVFGVHAANALATARMARNLDEAVDARHRIGLAQGTLMQRYGIDADQAFELLRRYSSASNLKLRDVAARVLETGDLPKPSSTEG